MIMTKNSFINKCILYLQYIDLDLKSRQHPFVIDDDTISFLKKFNLLNLPIKKVFFKTKEINRTQVWLCYLTLKGINSIPFRTEQDYFGSESQVSVITPVFVTGLTIQFAYELKHSSIRVYAAFNTKTVGEYENYDVEEYQLRHFYLNSRSLIEVRVLPVLRKIMRKSFDVKFRIVNSGAAAIQEFIKIKNNGTSLIFKDIITLELENGETHNYPCPKFDIPIQSGAKQYGNLRLL